MLRVKLVLLEDDDWGYMSKDDKKSLLRPLMEVTAPILFELSLPEANSSDDALWEALPCQIRRINPREFFEF